MSVRPASFFEKSESCQEYMPQTGAQPPVAGCAEEAFCMVRVFTNSVCDLTPAQAEELGVTMIPDMIAFGPGEQIGRAHV